MKTIRNLFIAFIAAFAGLSGYMAHAEDFSLGVVVGSATAVSDKGVITIRSASSNKEIPIILYGLALPEDPGTRAAAVQRIRDLIVGKHAAASIHRNLGPGRYEGVVSHKTNFHVHSILLREGLAKVDSPRCRNNGMCELFRRDEEVGKANNQGVWDK